jgi:5-methylcytosine-specific restriction endonuclease McrA
MSKVDKKVTIPSLWDRQSSRNEPKPVKVKGRAHRKPTESELRDVQLKAKSVLHACELLNISKGTYYKYMKLYEIDNEVTNPGGKGTPRNSRDSPTDRQAGYRMEDILSGKYPKYSTWRLKHRLLHSGMMEESCSNCGFCERRITDHRVPLVLDFIDGDRTNHVYENLRMLCFNCTFLIRGNVFGPTKEFIY